MAIFILAVIALTLPIGYDAIIPSKKHGRDIVLALDTSGSMRESGFSQLNEDKSKFELSQEIMSAFIDTRVSDNIGVVVFGTFAFSASPVTYDHESLKELLGMLEVEIAGKNTAIGDAIEQSIVTLNFAEAENRIIILITDGINNSGVISVKEAVERAVKEGIKIYTIGLGSEKDFDASLLQKISSETFGKSFSAKNAEELQEVYEEIDTLHPSNIRSEQYLNKKSLFTYPLFLTVFLLFWLLARNEGKV
ncbi:MAG TPA: VWA domain-containing protein [Campylobacterales bacterium]|nr:VWA domain-containing protein [Campylobacterales bacterium]HIP60530.1 VWA domain-containing protein [Campylobacterales bacterium]